MPQEIEKELMKCEAALYTMQSKYPELAKTAANARFVYDVAWAEQVDKITHDCTTRGEKLPTVAVMDAMVTLAVKDQMEDARKAEAELDGAKKHIDSLQSVLSSVQTRAKLSLMEMELSR